MKTIWKFQVLPNENVSMPKGATILSAGVQGEDIFIWALVDPDAPRLDRLISVYGTGHTILGDPGAFIGSVMMHGGTFVFHVFDAGQA
jgi:hypothetical protein